ncbi:MAG: TAXI family TRAP transporter solute-binding subunit [Clostridia bacterium]|nr:TAXI family TRAP transporter solute-binding subunit [Clostridia bacterium]
MKKTLALILAVLMMVALVPALALDADLSFGTQETGTAGYTYATAIQTVIQKVEGINVSLLTNSAGNVSSPVLIQEEEADLTMSNSAPALWAATTGIESANVPVCPDVRCIAGGLGHDFVNVMFTQKFVDETGIKTVEELVEKKYPIKLVIKKNGTLGELAAEKVFGVLGVTFDDIISWGGVVEKTGGAQIKDGLQDDLYEMTVDHIGAGQANTTELCINHAMYDVQLSDDTLAKLCAEGFDYVTVEPNTWNGQTTEIKTVGSQQCVLVSANLDEEVAYQITKAMCENKEILAEASAALGYFDPTVAGSKALTGCELHPGAARYYKEMGYAFE